MYVPKVTLLHNRLHVAAVEPNEKIRCIMGVAIISNLFVCIVPIDSNLAVVLLSTVSSKRK